MRIKLLANRKYRRNFIVRMFERELKFLIEYLKEDLKNNELQKISFSLKKIQKSDIELMSIFFMKYCCLKEVQRKNDWDTINLPNQIGKEYDKLVELNEEYEYFN